MSHVTYKIVEHDGGWAIEYETADGKWHTETAAGSDCPDTDVQDKA